MIKQDSANGKKDQYKLRNNLLKIGEDISTELDRLLADVADVHRRINIYKLRIVIFEIIDHVSFGQP